MLRVFLSASLALALVGCATLQQPQARANKVHVVKAVSKPIAVQTPNQTVKKRWYDRFKVHPKWFHH